MRSKRTRANVAAVVLALIAVPAILALVAFAFDASSASATSVIEVVDGPDGWRAIVDRTEAWGSSDARLRLQPPEDGAAPVVLVPWGESWIGEVHWEQGPLLAVSGRRRDGYFPCEYTPSYRHVAIRYDWAR